MTSSFKNLRSPDDGLGLSDTPSWTVTAGYLAVHCHPLREQIRTSTAGRVITGGQLASYRSFGRPTRRPAAMTEAAATSILYRSTQPPRLDPTTNGHMRLAIIKRKDNFFCRLSLINAWSNRHSANFLYKHILISKKFCDSRTPLRFE